jgi:hypothetical protein
MSESDPLDRPATPEEIEIVKRLLTRTRPAENVVSLPKRPVMTRVPRATRRSPGRRRSGASRFWQTMTTADLIEAATALTRRIDKTSPGMAHLSGTGPPGTVCEQCFWYGFSWQNPNSCHRYFLMTSQHGAAFPADTPSCKRFAPSGPEAE